MFPVHLGQYGSQPWQYGTSSPAPSAIFCNKNRAIQDNFSIQIQDLPYRNTDSQRKSVFSSPSSTDCADTRFCFVCCSLAWPFSCGSHPYTPKPRGCPRSLSMAIAEEGIIVFLHKITLTQVLFFTGSSEAHFSNDPFDMWVGGRLENTHKKSAPLSACSSKITPWVIWLNNWLRFLTLYS